MAKLSVLIPVYNTERTLKRCLDSILNQTLKDIEIVIVNDGSEDQSQDIIKEYAERNKNIKWIYQSNQGLGAARNKGIELSQGEYVAFLDSDDWVDGDYYSKLYNHAKKEESELVISSYIIEKEGDKNKSKAKHYFSSKDEYLMALIEGKVAGFSWNKLYKKSLIINNKLKFPIRGVLENVEDQFFSTRCVVLANKISFMNESNIHYMIYSDSIARKYQKTLYRDILMLYKENKVLFRHLRRDPKILEIILLNGLISIVNNEFKPERNVGLSKKINLIKNVLQIPEYRKALGSFKNYKFKKIYLLYLILLRQNMTGMLFLLAGCRCKIVHLRSGIYR